MSISFASTACKPLRLLQAGCAAIVLAGIVPWSQLAGSAVVGAIHSEQAPLTLSIAAWLVLLLPLWVGWFAVQAWQQRHDSCRAAVLMALPSLIIVAVALVMSPAQAMP